MSNVTEKHLKISLTAQWRVTEDWLYIEYGIENQGEIPIVAYDGAKWDINAEWPDMFSQLYVSFEEPNIVHIKRICPPLPKKFDITFVRIPSVSRILPSEVRKVTFRLSLPLRERSEYFPHFDKASYCEKTARKIILWIGYVPEVKDMKLIPCADGADVYRLQGSRPLQQFLTTEIDLTIPVYVRKDNDRFERV